MHTKRGNQTIVIVPMPHPGVKCVRPLTVFGYDDAPHGHAEVWLENVELDESAVVLGEGKGFLISQSRLGPGRIHHCMRAVGLAARCYELMLERTFRRHVFGKYLHEHGSCRELIADSASDLEAARLLTLACAEEIDRLGAKGARDKIALIKVTVPELTSRVVDRAVQVRGVLFFCVCLLNAYIFCLRLNFFISLDLRWGWRKRRLSFGQSPGRFTNSSYCRWSRRCTQANISTVRT